MKTREQIIQAVKDGALQSNGIDGRDFARLTDFFPPDAYALFGFELMEGKTPPEPEELTDANVLERLKDDLEFAFKKALNKRGISAALMHGVIRMWLWVLDDPLQDFDEYAEYGLPLFKAVAVKYSLPNPIGEDAGSESKYSMHGYNPAFD